MNQTDRSRSPIAAVAVPRNAARTREPLALVIELTPDQLDAIAERVAQRLGATCAEDGWLRGADRIAAYIDCPRSRVYALTSADRIPVERDGSNLIARPVRPRSVAAGRRW